MSRGGSGDTLSPAAGGGFLTQANRAIFRAYQDPGSREYGVLFEATTFLVIVSLLSMVLEGVPEIAERYEAMFLWLEVAVASLFILDYAGNVYTAPSKRAYIFGFWGLIDLLAILPVFLTFTNITGLRAARTADGLRGMRSMRAGRALRAVRLARVVRVAKVAERFARSSHAPGSRQHGVEIHASLWRDMQLGLIVVCSVLALAELVVSHSDDHLFWLLFGAAAAANVAVRRLFLRRDRWLLAAGVASAGLAAGTGLYAWALLAADPKAALIGILTLLFVTGSVIAVEHPARRRAEALPEPASL